MPHPSSSTPHRTWVRRWTCGPWGCCSTTCWWGVCPSAVARSPSCARPFWRGPREGVWCTCPLASRKAPPPSSANCSRATPRPVRGPPNS
uniref:Protein kinase domain-containing protein n=1 Tax=Mesocestoides corti TaxID=53468 RepID=A0A5K3EXW3_MESCO